MKRLAFLEALAFASSASADIAAHIALEDE